jgi:hypothetical protein
MGFIFRPMQPNDVLAIAAWHYDEPYTNLLIMVHTLIDWFLLGGGARPSGMCYPWCAYNHALGWPITQMRLA